jgi:hypothetical protein
MADIGENILDGVVNEGKENFSLALHPHCGGIYVHDANTMFG